MKVLKEQDGVAYIAMLFMVTVAGIALMMAAEMWSTTEKRMKEAELLYKGREIALALGSFYKGSPGIKRYPLTLEELLKDKRFRSTKRHLRKVYPDPMTGKADWELIKNKQGGIIGISSTSTERPMKQANFKEGMEEFEDSASYAEWRFIYKDIIEAPLKKKEKKG